MIRTRGLSYTYATGGAAPLRFPDVDLRQGGTLLLRGRSGSGKSTWLALMAGLRGASGGDLFVAGTQLGTQRGAEIDAWRALAQKRQQARQNDGGAIVGHCEAEAAACRSRIEAARGEQIVHAFQRLGILAIGEAIKETVLAHSLAIRSFSIWLARNVMGTYRAVKVVYRETFSESRPYEREFSGIVTRCPANAGSSPIRPGAIWAFCCSIACVSSCIVKP